MMEVGGWSLAGFTAVALLFGMGKTLVDFKNNLRNGPRQPWQV